MTIGHKYEFSWFSAAVPKTVYAPAATTSGTYQASATYQGKLHVLMSDSDLTIEGGTGSSVTATSKLQWFKKTPFYFIPSSSKESLGWASSSSATVTIAVVEPTA